MPSRWRLLFLVMTTTALGLPVFAASNDDLRPDWSQVQRPPAASPPRQPRLPQPKIVAPHGRCDESLPIPRYPAEAIAARREGQVILRLYVLDNGSVLESQISSSSGYADLDQAAVEQSKRWVLEPGTINNVAQSMWMEARVHFRVNTNGTGVVIVDQGLDDQRRCLI